MIWTRSTAALGVAAGLLAGLLLVVLTGEPGVVTGERLFGSGTADAWGHMWGYGWVAEALASGGLPFHNAPIRHPELQTWWVIDLPTALAVSPVARVAPGLALNLAFLLHVALGAAGAAVWLRRRGAHEGVALTGAVVVATSPFVRGAVTSGVPEALVVLLAPWLLLALESGLRGRAAHLVAATVLAFVLSLDGPYGAFVVASIGLLAAIEARLERRSPGPLLRVSPVAGATLLAAVWTRHAVAASEHPALVAALDRDALADATSWVHRVLGGADLASFWVPSFALPDLASATGHRHTVYVGVLLAGAALLAAWRRPAARPLLAFAVVAGGVALGPELRVWGELTGLPLPGTLVWDLGATNLYRLAGLVPLALVGCVALGWRPRRAIAVLLCVGLDGLMHSPLRVQLATVQDPAGPVEAWLAEQPTGGVLDLPFDREGEMNRGALPQRSFGLQAHHHQPLASGLYRETVPMHPRIGGVDGAIARRWQMELGRDLDAHEGRRDARAVRSPGLPPVPTGAPLETLSASLAANDFRYAVLDLEAVHPEQRSDVDAWMTAWLGEPSVASSLRRAWVLPEGAPTTPRRSREAEPAGSPAP